jgi:hypothetical protein
MRLSSAFSFGPGSCERSPSARTDKQTSNQTSAVLILYLFIQSTKRGGLVDGLSQLSVASRNESGSLHPQTNHAQRDSAGRTKEETKGEMSKGNYG